MHARGVHTHHTPSSLRRLAVTGSLALTAVAAFAGPSVAHAAPPNQMCGQSVFVNAYSWNPHLTADDAGSDSVSGPGYSIDFQWTVDWDALTGAVDAQITGGDYSLIGANMWYTVPVEPEFEGDTSEGGLPETDSFSHTLSSSSSYVFDNPEITSIYFIQLVIAQCGESVPTTEPAGPTTDPVTPTTGVGGSGGTLPSTGASPSAVLLAVLVGATGVALVRFPRRRPRLS